MAIKLRGHKTKIVNFRLTPRQHAALENLAIERDATISDVLREAIQNMTSPYQNSNTSGYVLPDAAGIAH